MAKHYDELPCVKLSGVVHLTVSGTRCACGHQWPLDASDRDTKLDNIIWLDKAAITCPGCLAFFDCITAPVSNIRS